MSHLPDKALDLYKRILGKQLTVHECPDCGCVMLGIYAESPTDGHILTQCLGCKKVKYKVFCCIDDWKPRSATAPEDEPGIMRMTVKNEGMISSYNGGGTAAIPQNYRLGGGTALPPEPLTLG